MLDASGVAIRVAATDEAHRHAGLRRQRTDEPGVDLARRGEIRCAEQMPVPIICRKDTAQRRFEIPVERVRYADDLQLWKDAGVVLREVAGRADDRQAIAEHPQRFVPRPADCHGPVQEARQVLEAPLPALAAASLPAGTVAHEAAATGQQPPVVGGDHHRLAAIPQHPRETGPSDVPMMYRVQVDHVRFGDGIPDRRGSGRRDFPAAQQMRCEVREHYLPGADHLDLRLGQCLRVRRDPRPVAVEQARLVAGTSQPLVQIIGYASGAALSGADVEGQDSQGRKSRAAAHQSCPPRGPETARSASAGVRFSARWVGHRSSERSM